MGAGGAVFVHGGMLTVVNATLTGNTARGGTAAASVLAQNRGNGGQGAGGALFNLNGTVQVLNTTLAANTVTGGAGQTQGAAFGGALYNVGFGTGTTAVATLHNSILATSVGGPDMYADAVQGTSTVDASSPNLIMASATKGGATLTGNPVSVDPQLGSLADNTGPTQTMAIQNGSPAAGVGNPSICAGSPVSNLDQRGQPRDCLCDLGAFAQPQTLPCPVRDMSGQDDDGGMADGGQVEDGDVDAHGSLGGYTQLQGGGLGCQTTRSGATPVAGYGLVCVWVGLLWRTRRKQPQR